MALTKAQLLTLLADMPDSTEIVVPSYRNPATSVTQIARTDWGSGPTGDLMLILVPASILPFRPSIPDISKEASNESPHDPNPSATA